MIDGKTKLIAHLGYPTESFKAPMIYNPYFRKHGINAVVVPMGCKSEDYAAFLKLVFKLSNIHGALVTMPHKVVTVEQLDEASVSVKVAGACNAIRIDGNVVRKTEARAGRWPPIANAAASDRIDDVARRCGRHYVVRCG